MPKLLSFRGGLGAGKTYAANHLVLYHNFIKVSFADALKLEVFSALWVGYHESFHLYTQHGAAYDIDQLSSGVSFREVAEGLIRRKDVLKVRPNTDFAKLELQYISDQEKVGWVNKHKLALRPLLQFYGTQYRRAQDEDYWLKQWKLKVASLLAAGNDVTVDDARFHNEIDTITGMGGTHIFIYTEEDLRKARLTERDGKLELGLLNHESEALAKFSSWDTMFIRNDSDKGSFESEIEAVVKLLGTAT